ncbi:MAG: hypothetical protein IT337_11135 [Thermomicrobiales bacterium]|nr:hypothetical protein [Thermomicrobiales bacterium]
MFDRENWVGMVLLAVCVVAGGVLLHAIATGSVISFEGPPWLSPILLLLYVGGLVIAWRRMPGTRL